MSSKLTIGKIDRKVISFPVDLVTETLSILGRRGSGKTNTATVCVEEMLEQNLQVVILDPVGVWWGLRSTADGKREGYKTLIIGGPKGDIPINEADSETLADFIVENSVSCIVSLDGLESIASVKRFITKFADRLYQRKKSVDFRSPVMVVIEEASTVVPQRVQKDEGKMVAAIQRLVRQGRNFGIGVTLIDQRPASINKDVLTQTEVLITHQITSPHDRRAVEAWVEAHDALQRRGDFMKSLASLETGEAWIWSPGWLNFFDKVRIRKRHTFDSSSTPKIGQVKKGPIKQADIDLTDLRQKLARTIEEEEANNPKLLKSRIAELERQITKVSQDVEIDPEEVEILVQMRVQEVTKSMREQFEAQAGKKVREFIEGLKVTLDEELENVYKHVAFDQEVELPKPTKNLAAKISLSRRTPVRSTKAKRHTSGGGTGPGEKLPKAEKAILAVLAPYAPDTRSHQQIAVMAGYKHSGGAFNNALSSLRTSGYIEGGKQAICITEEGKKALGSWEPLPQGPNLLQFWLDHKSLGKAERTILQSLYDNYPHTTDKDSLAIFCEYEASGGAFNNALSRLRSLGLIKGKGREPMVCSDIFFE